MFQLKTLCLNTLTGGHCIRTGSRRKHEYNYVCLNTLTGGHCIRTYPGTYSDPPAWYVSIPSQVGTVFGLCGGCYGRDLWYVSIPSQVGTVFGRSRASTTSASLLSLNTLTGGHCIRTPGSTT